MAKKKSKGLGDVIENITSSTGIKKVVEIFTPEGKDCGCDKRKDTLNRKYPNLKSANCFNKEQHDDWVKFKEFRTLTDVIKHDRVLYVCKLYSEIFNLPYWKPSCFACSGTARAMSNMIDKLDLIHNTYESN